MSRDFESGYVEGDEPEQCNDCGHYRPLDARCYVCEDCFHLGDYAIFESEAE